MPEDVKKEAVKELTRLARMSPMAADYSLTRNYIECWRFAMGQEFGIKDRHCKAKEILDEGPLRAEKGEGPSS